MVKKQKQDCIKHKLWGKLKKEAHDFYCVKAHYSTNTYSIWRPRYDYENWMCSDEFDYMRAVDNLKLEEVQEKLDELRQERFWLLCTRALFKKRVKKLEHFK